MRQRKCFIKISNVGNLIAFYIFCFYSERNSAKTGVNSNFGSYGQLQGKEEKHLVFV